MQKYILSPGYTDSMPVDISGAFGDEAPAGKHGFVKVNGESLCFEDGTPARFWGVCMNGAACFPSHEYSEKVARRLAMAGVNCVRLHQLDGEFHTPNIFQFRKGTRLTSTRKFDETSMDRLDYFIYCMKKNGVYCYLDNMVFRHFKSGDGVVDADKMELYAGRPYSIFDPTMIELQKEYSTNLWTHVNPYTGLAYKDDPVFILTEIVNETHIWHKHYFPSKGRTAPKHVPYYENLLRSQLKQWAEENKADVDADTVDIWSLEEDVVNRFKLEKTWEYNKTMYEHLRGLGIKIPITGCNWVPSETGSFNLYAQKNACDYMDGHHYYYDWAWGEDEKVGVNAQINGYEEVLGNLPKMHIKDRPFFVSEWGSPFPNSYRAEAPIYYAAVGALQGWSGMTIHTYAYAGDLERVDVIGKQFSSATVGGVSYREGVFSCWNDPSIFGLFYHSALMLRRADITPADKKVGVRAPFSLKFPKKAYGDVLERHRVVSLLEGQDETGCDIVMNADEAMPREEKNIIMSDNGQMWRHLGRKFGAIDTPRTKIIYGKMARIAQSISNPFPETFVSGMKVVSQTDFGVIALSSLTDDPISKSDNLLLSAIGRSRNTDSQFDGEKLVDYGHAPIVAEAIRATITVETERTDLCIWGINAEGAYVGRVPATFENGKMTFTIGNQYPCLYYLISVD